MQDTRLAGSQSPFETQVSMQVLIALSAETWPTAMTGNRKKESVRRTKDEGRRTKSIHGHLIFLIYFRLTEKCTCGASWYPHKENGQAPSLPKPNHKWEVRRVKIILSFGLPPNPLFPDHSRKGRYLPETSRQHPTIISHSGSWSLPCYVSAEALEPPQPLS